MQATPISLFEQDPFAEIIPAAEFLRQCREKLRDDTKGTAYPVVCGEIAFDHIILTGTFPPSVPLNATHILWIPT